MGMRAIVFRVICVYECVRKPLRFRRWRPALRRVSHFRECCSVQYTHSHTHTLKHDLRVIPNKFARVVVAVVHTRRCAHMWARARHNLALALAHTRTYDTYTHAREQLQWTQKKRVAFETERQIGRDRDSWRERESDTTRAFRIGGEVCAGKGGGIGLAGGESNQPRSINHRASAHRWNVCRGFNRSLIAP